MPDFNEISDLDVRDAIPSDRKYVIELIKRALAPYYGGDHEAHATRIFDTHISGQRDHIGHFSLEQRMFVATLSGVPVGIVHLVGKRQRTYKISPIIVDEAYRKRGVGQALVRHAEQYATDHDAREVYCTVAEENEAACQLFLRNGYNIAGKSASHYKLGITETMLYKQLSQEKMIQLTENSNISVTPADLTHEPAIRDLLQSALPTHFDGIGTDWLDALFAGYNRRGTRDINQKYKLLYVATDQTGSLLGIVGATPKKGTPIKLMPFIATNIAAFRALLTDLPFQLKPFGHKLYIHILPSVEETIELQQRGWKLDAALPGAYHPDIVTQQWSFDLRDGDVMRMMRVKQHFLDLILSGRKTLEVRVGYDSIKTISKGERIRISSSTHSALIMVTDVRRYENFEKMLESESPDLIAPGMSRENVLQLLRQLYPQAKESLGVIVLEIKVI